MPDSAGADACEPADELFDSTPTWCAELDSEEQCVDHFATSLHGERRPCEWLDVGCRASITRLVCAGKARAEDAPRLPGTSANGAIGFTIAVEPAGEAAPSGAMIPLFPATAVLCVLVPVLLCIRARFGRQGSELGRQGKPDDDEYPEEIFVVAEDEGAEQPEPDSFPMQATAERPASLTTEASILAEATLAAVTACSSARELLARPDALAAPAAELAGMVPADGPALAAADQAQAAGWEEVQVAIPAPLPAAPLTSRAVGGAAAAADIFARGQARAPSGSEPRPEPEPVPDRERIIEESLLVGIESDKDYGGKRRVHEVEEDDALEFGIAPHEDTEIDLSAIRRTPDGAGGSDDDLTVVLGGGADDEQPPPAQRAPRQDAELLVFGGDDDDEGAEEGAPARADGYGDDDDDDDDDDSDSGDDGGDPELPALSLRSAFADFDDGGLFLRQPEKAAEAAAAAAASVGTAESPLDSGAPLAAGASRRVKSIQAMD